MHQTFFSRWAGAVTLLAFLVASTVARALEPLPPIAPAPISMAVKFPRGSTNVPAAARAELAQLVDATRRFTGSEMVCASVASDEAASRANTRAVVLARETAVAGTLLKLGLQRDSVFRDRRFGPRADHMFVDWQEEPGELSVVFFACR